MGEFIASFSARGQETLIWVAEVLFAETPSGAGDSVRRCGHD